jgi:hypothetical protein
MSPTSLSVSARLRTRSSMLDKRGALGQHANKLCRRRAILEFGRLLARRIASFRTSRAVRSNSFLKLAAKWLCLANPWRRASSEIRRRSKRGSWSFWRHWLRRRRRKTSRTELSISANDYCRFLNEIPTALAIWGINPKMLSRYRNKSKSEDDYQRAEPLLRRLA